MPVLILKRRLSTLIAASALLTAPLASPLAASSDTYQQLDLLMDAFERIRAEYVEDVEDKELVEAAIRGMLTSLDPHSSYLSQEGYSALNEATRGEYGGLGIEVSMEEGVIKVISPIEDTPADRAGVEGGDLITHIDGDPIVGKSLTEAVKLMRGPADTPITITIIRDGVDDPFDITIVREAIQVRSVRHRIEDETIGYVRVTTFNEQTGSGLRESLAEIRKELGEDLDGIVLDLRNNPGGLLDQAIEVSDMFLEDGKEIVSTRGRDRDNTYRANATAGDLSGGVPVVVLVNAFTASASEIVAGALQDHRRGTIMGIPTFGKGTVQTIIRLGRGDRGMRLTTGRYYTPSGRSIQELGIDPDIEVYNAIPDEERRGPRRERDLDNHIINEQVGDGDMPDTKERLVVRAPEPLEEGEEPVDFQLRYAIDHLKGVAAVPIKQASAASGL